MIIIKVETSMARANKVKFEEILTGVANSAVKLNGCLGCYWFQHGTLPNSYFVYEEFSDMQAFQNYKKSKVVEMIVDQLIPLTLSKPKYKHFEATVFEEG